MPKSYALRILLFAGLLFVVLAATWAGVNFIGTSTAPGEPAVSRAVEITGIENPLDDNGDIDYFLLANIRPMIGVKKDNNVAVPIVETCDPEIVDKYPDRFFYLLSMERPDPDTPKFVTAEDWIGEHILSPENSAKTPTADKFAKFGVHHLWQDDELPELARWLESIEGTLKLLSEAAKRERFYLPVVSTDPSKARFFSVGYDMVSHVKVIAEAFKIRANYYLATGDFENWLEDVETIYSLGRQVSGGNSIVNQLVSVGIHELGDEAVASAAINAKLDAEQLSVVKDKLAEIPNVSGLSRSIRDGERLLVLDLMTEFARHGAAAYGESEDLGAYKSMLLKTADWNQVIEIINTDSNRVADMMDLPAAEMLEAINKFEADMDRRSSDYGSPVSEIGAFLAGRKAKGKLLGNQFADVFLPRPTSYGPSILRQWSQRSMTKLAVALELYRQSKGSYPEKLEQLIPEFYEGPVVDSFTGAQFVYRLDGNPTELYSYELYSLGVNGTDEGGPQGVATQYLKDIELGYTRYLDWYEYLVMEENR